MILQDTQIIALALVVVGSCVIVGPVMKQQFEKEKIKMALLKQFQGSTDLELIRDYKSTLMLWEQMVSREKTLQRSLFESPSSQTLISYKATVKRVKELQDDLVHLSAYMKTYRQIDPPRN